MLIGALNTTFAKISDSSHRQMALFLRQSCEIPNYAGCCAFKRSHFFSWTDCT